MIFRGSINICKIDYEKGACATISPKTKTMFHEDTYPLVQHM
jgi:hypothetical protein